MPVRGRFLGFAACLALVGCASADHTSAMTTPGRDAPPPAAHEIEAEDIRIDLGPQGIAATIVAPHDAKARSTPDGVDLESENGFHLMVRRGSLDPLKEKARIVRAYGPSFARFIRDEGTEVVYETMLAGKKHYHFFLTSGPEAPIPHHCLTADGGAESLEEVEAMVEACQEIRFVADVDPGEHQGGVDSRAPQASP